MSYGFLVFKPKVAIPSAKELTEDAVEMLEPPALHALLREILPDLGEPYPEGTGTYIPYQFGEAHVGFRLNEGFIGLSTRGLDRPGVRELLRKLLDAGLVIFDSQTAQLFLG